MPSLSFLGDAGETVLLLLGLGPVVAVGLAAWLFAEATVDERRRLRWLVLCLLIGLGVVTVMQLVRKLGLLDVGDGFLAAFPAPSGGPQRWSGPQPPSPTTSLVTPPPASRRVAVGVGLVSCVGAAGGLVWVAVDATTGHIVGFAPSPRRAVLAMAALVLPVAAASARARGEPVAVGRPSGSGRSKSRAVGIEGVSSHHRLRCEQGVGLLGGALQHTRCVQARDRTALHRGIVSCRR